MTVDPTVEFYVHDGARILRTGHCPRSLLTCQARKGQTAVEGKANDRAEKIIDGVKVARTRQEIAAEREIQPPPAPGEDIVTIRRKEWEELLRRISILEAS